MGQNPNRIPSEHPNPTTKIGTKMGGEFTYPNNWTQFLLTTTAISGKPLLGGLDWCFGI